MSRKGLCVVGECDQMLAGVSFSGSFIHASRTAAMLNWLAALSSAPGLSAGVQSPLGTDFSVGSAGVKKSPRLSS